MCAKRGARTVRITIPIDSHTSGKGIFVRHRVADRIQPHSMIRPLLTRSCRWVEMSRRGKANVVFSVPGPPRDRGSTYKGRVDIVVQKFWDRQPGSSCSSLSASSVQIFICIVRPFSSSIHGCIQSLSNFVRVGH